jgi:predicted dehydrogenase
MEADVSTHGIAVIGTGYIGGEHIRAIAAHGQARLQTICCTERSLDAAAALMQTHGAARVTTSYQDVLADPEVDVVYLCTPNSGHEDQAVAALEAGKHVFVEKPLAVTVAGCRRIVSAARDSGRQVMVGHGARFSPIFVAIHKLVLDGTLGDACFVEGDYVHDLGPFLDLPGHDWWMDVDNEGQLPIIGGACHPLDLMRWIAGEIVEVSAYGARRNIPQAPWYDTIITNVKFASGAVGKCLVSCGAKVPYALNLSYYGTKGTVINNRLFIDGIPHVEQFMQLPVTIRAEDHTCAEELDHFLHCIDSGETPLIDATDGARSVAVCCALAESIELGRPVEVQLDF